MTDVRPRPEPPASSAASGLDDELVAVLRYSDHADPLYCACGLTWGAHACTNTPPSDEYRYDFANPANALVKIRHGYSLTPAGTRAVFR